MKFVLIALILIVIGIAYFRVGPKVGNQPSPSSPTPQVNHVNETDLTIKSDYSIKVFAKGITGARDLQFSPGGTLLVSSTTVGEVYALPDKNKDEKSNQTKTILTGLNRPHGLVFYGTKLYVAEETKVSRYAWDEQKLEAKFEKKLFDLPKGDRHFTRSIVFDQNGNMYVSIGSTCDVCTESNPLYASILISDSEGKTPKIYAKGLRNSVFMAQNSTSGEIWATEMGRDYLGDNLPPDEINIIKDGKDYGWPLCYGNQVHDTDFDKKAYIQIFPQPPCAATEPPVFQIPAHSAPLGLTFIKSDLFPKDWQGDLLVAYHGSTNSTTPKGYKVVHIKMQNGKPTTEEDFITGFIKGKDVSARPVDVAFSPSGSLFISDDKSGNIYKVN